MKRRLMAGVLSLTMALSAAVPSMATGQPTTAVRIEDVPGGVVVAYLEDGQGRKYFPIGEDVPITRGTTVHYETEPVSEDGFTTACEKVELIGADGKAQSGTPDKVSGTFNVGEEKITVRASFAPQPTPYVEETYITIHFKDPFYESAQEQGSTTVQSVEMRMVKNGVSATETLPLDKVQLAMGAKDGFTYDDSKGTLTWKSLPLGDPSLSFTLTYGGKSYTSAAGDGTKGKVDIQAPLQAGYKVSMSLPLAYAGANEESMITGSETAIYVAGSVTAAEYYGLLTGAAGAAAGGKFELYNDYKFSDWLVHDSASGYKDTVVAETETTKKLADRAGGHEVQLYARFVKDGKAYHHKVGNLLADDKVPGTAAELKNAVAGLTAPAADASDGMKGQFEQKVASVIRGMKKLGSSSDRDAAMSKLGEILKQAFGITFEKKGVEVDESILVAAGITNYAYKDSTVTVSVTDVATGSNASPAEFTVGIEAKRADGSSIPLKGASVLDFPVTLTVTLPKGIADSMAKTGRKYTVKIDGKEIESVFNPLTGTLTFRTDRLGRFSIVMKGSSGSGSGSGGGSWGSWGSGSSGGSGGNVSHHLGGSGTNRGESGVWVRDAIGWWYKYNSGGYPVSRWELIKNKWYYFNANGYMATGWQLIKGVWYYLDEVNGDMATGWRQIRGVWYYLNEGNGDMATGWKLVNGVWYYLNEGSGAMATGWKLVNGVWYYLNEGSGAMATGWKLVNGVWYHLDEGSGAMDTGWYLDPSDGRWYYLDPSGAMLTGWQLVNGKYYYLCETSGTSYEAYDPATGRKIYIPRRYGSMYANEVTPDGYKVDASGARVR